MPTSARPGTLPPRSILPPVSSRDHRLTFHFSEGGTLGEGGRGFSGLSLNAAKVRSAQAMRGVTVETAKAVRDGPDEYGQELSTRH
jgi:hypothetical protein